MKEIVKNWILKIILITSLSVISLMIVLAIGGDNLSSVIGWMSGALAMSGVHIIDRQK